MTEHNLCPVRPTMVNCPSTVDVLCDMRIRRGYIAILAVVAATGAAGAGVIAGTLNAHAVANGQSAPPGAVPFNVKLTSNDIPVLGGGVRSGACSGALIAPQWVITAGHCFHDINGKRVSGKSPYDMTATIGRTDDSDRGGHVLQVVQVSQSPVNDVSLAKLAAPVTDIQPIAPATQPPAAGEQLEIAGWGATSAKVVAPSTHLNLGQFAVSSVQDATVLVHGVSPAADTSACPDDSGAPYFVPGGQLVSIENTGPDCPHAADETTARVDVITDWISRQVG